MADLSKISYIQAGKKTLKKLNGPSRGFKPHGAVKQTLQVDTTI